MFLATWYEGLSRLQDARTERDREAWRSVLAVRDAVARELERLRVAGDIGSSLDAEVDLYCDSGLAERVRWLQDELRFVLITSYARLHPLERAPANAIQSDVPGLRLTVEPSRHAKCARCWHHRDDVGAQPDHPELCGRCVTNIQGAGEQREFA